MIIHAPVLQIIGNPKESQKLQISSKITWTQKHRTRSTTLWFRFPVKYKEEISCDIDPFVVATLLLAMQLKEDIYLESSISRDLLTALDKYQGVFHQWFPQRFFKVKIKPFSIREREEHSSTPPLMKNLNQGCAFSGGVDSFYTFLSLYKNSKVTHTLFMAGFDMPLQLEASIGELTTSYAELMRKFKIEFIAGSTNLRALLDTVDWTNAHGPALIASSLFFKRVWKSFFIPSSYTSQTYPKWGSHPDLDKVLSTSELEFIHHGEELNRTEKLELISKHSLAFDQLRVCWIQDIGLRNCGKCEKCLRTMIALEILGTLPSFSTFDDSILNRSKVRSLTMRTHQGRLFAKELIIEAAKRKKYAVCFDLAFALFKRTLFRTKYFSKHLFKEKRS